MHVGEPRVAPLPPVFQSGRAPRNGGSAASRKAQDKLQWIVAQRLLSALTTPGFNLSHLQKSYRIQHPKQHWPSSLSRQRELVRSMAHTYLWSCKIGSDGQHCLASRDSELEAFSHNPTDGRFAVLAFQLAAFAK